MQSFRNTEAAQRLAERRRREDEAPRLKAEVPALTKLDLELSDRKGVADPASMYVRRVVVTSAPALFEVPCTDSSCKEGGHDITHQVMRALREHRTAFEGDDVCNGSVGSSHCGRTLRYVVKASFEEA